MRRLLLATIALASLAVPASARTVWQGDVFITAANSICQSAGWPVGNYLRVEFRPHNLTDNGSNTYLGLYSPRSAQTYSIAGKGLVAGTYAAGGITSTAFPQGWTSTFSGVSVSPAPKLTTKTVTIKATITNFFNNTGCTVTIQGAAFQRPDL
jgi:hypothetical protein